MSQHLQGVKIITVLDFIAVCALFSFQTPAKHVLMEVQDCLGDFLRMR